VIRIVAPLRVRGLKHLENPFEMHTF